MTTPTSPLPFAAPLREMQRWALDWLVSWWQLLHFTVLVATLAFAPSSYNRRARPVLAREIVLGTAPHLLWFSLMTTFISLVIIRIVVVTSASYGLSRYALEMVVRVLVLELIPLTVALFVALRNTLPAGVAFAQQLAETRNKSGGFQVAHSARLPADVRQSAPVPDGQPAAGDAPTLGEAAEEAAAAAPARLAQAAGRDAELRGISGLQREFFPRAMAGMFAVWLLGAVSCVLTLVLAYLSIYGFTPYALQGYTRVVGQIFNPAMSMILVLKIVFFSFAVGMIPLASAYFGASARLRHVHGLSDMVRMFSVLLLIEAASLMGNYY
ncbi:MlaE family ABC transporter permease [Pseudoduganella rivuli]|nr:ABC transporter permease [Pseudoduganella rivuli]